MKRQQALDGLGHAASRHLGRETGEVRALCAHASAQHHEVLGDGTTADLADAALETDPGHVVLAATVRAAADLHVETGSGGDPIRPGREVLREQPAERRASA